MGPHYTGTPPLPSGHGISLSKDPFLLVVTFGAQNWRPIQTCSLGPTPTLVLTSGGYGLKASGTHLTEMLSCETKDFMPSFQF